MEPGVTRTGLSKEADVDATLQSRIAEAEERHFQRRRRSRRVWAAVDHLVTLALAVAGITGLVWFVDLVWIQLF